jgi:hypothetical protein
MLKCSFLSILRLGLSSGFDSSGSSRSLSILHRSNSSNMDFTSFQSTEIFYLSFTSLSTSILRLSISSMI